MGEQEETAGQLAVSPRSDGLHVAAKTNCELVQCLSCANQINPTPTGTFARLLVQCELTVISLSLPLGIDFPNRKDWAGGLRQ